VDLWVWRTIEKIRIQKNREVDKYENVKVKEDRGYEDIK